MINKAALIRKLLKQGKTTREIAQELRVSLRDIGLVRKQEGIDIGALVRQRNRLEKNLDDLDNSIVQRRSNIAGLEKQLNDLQRTKISLEAAIERKRNEIKQVQQPVELIYFPQNYGEVERYLETLSLDQLRSLVPMILDIINDRVAHEIHDFRHEFQKEAVKQVRKSLRS